MEVSDKKEKKKGNIPKKIQGKKEIVEFVLMNRYTSNLDLALARCGIGVVQSSLQLSCGSMIANFRTFKFWMGHDIG